MQNKEIGRIKIGKNYLVYDKQNHKRMNKSLNCEIKRRKHFRRSFRLPV
jgi:hypothetical protein